MDSEAKIENLLSRRMFCLRACQIASVAAFGGILGSVLQSCTQPNNPVDNASSLPTINGTVSNNTIAVSTGSGSPVAAVGSAALVQFSSGSVLLAHTAASTFVAVSAICPHQGCLINGFSGGSYVCPCHGSTFTTSGQVTRGPAGSNLPQYATTVGNNQVIITL